MLDVLKFRFWMVIHEERAPLNYAPVNNDRDAPQYAPVNNDPEPEGPHLGVGPVPSGSLSRVLPRRWPTTDR